MDKNEPLWKPADQRRLHYNELYRGIYGFLKMPPDTARKEDAIAYLEDLERSYHYHNVLQGDRIKWTRAWLKALSHCEEK